MNYLIGAVALAVLGIGLVWLKINTPEGGHRRPPWWRRWREERAQERAQDALNLRLIQDISNGLRGEVTRATTPRAPRADWPLQPLPPGAEEHADHFHRWAAEPEEGAPSPLLEPELAHYDDPQVMAYAHMPHPEWARPPGEPEDPMDVATPGQVADTYVGALEETSQPPGTGSSGTLEVTSKPEPDPVVLTDYRETTGSWEAIRDDVLAGGE